MVGMIVAHVERRQLVLDEAMRLESHGVLTQLYVQVGCTVKLELSGSYAGYTYLTIDIIMQLTAFTFGQFATQVKLLLRIFHIFRVL